MLSDEAPSFSEPQKHESKKRTKKIYTTILYFMIVVIIGLVVNNFIIYNWYNQSKHKYTDTFLRVQSINEEKQEYPNTK